LGKGIFFLPRQFKSVLAFREVFLYKSQQNNFEQKIPKTKENCYKNKTKNRYKVMMGLLIGRIGSKRALQFT
jgi:hypothetical protein